MLPFKSLDAVTAPTTGLVRDLEGVACRFTVTFVRSDAVGDAHSTTAGTEDLLLRGSLDGEAWFRLVGAQLSESQPDTGLSVLTVGDNPRDEQSGAEFAHYVRYVRADVDHLTAGTISAWVVAADIHRG